MIFVIIFVSFKMSCSGTKTFIKKACICVYHIAILPPRKKKNEKKSKMCSLLIWVTTVESISNTQATKKEKNLYETYFAFV